MKSKNIKLSVSLALAAVFGAANSSGAATFAPGSSITFVQTVYQINAAGNPAFIPGSVAPETDGYADGLFDLIAGVYNLEGGSNLSPTNVVLNRPIDADGNPLEVGNTAVGYEVGLGAAFDAKGDGGVIGTATLGEALIGANNMGIPFDDRAYTYSADGVLTSELSEVNGTGANPPYYNLVTVYDPDSGSVTNEFALTQITTFCYNPTTVGTYPVQEFGSLSGTCPSGTFAFEGTGFVENDGDITFGKWDFNGVGFTDLGTGGDINPDDGVTRLTGNDLVFTVDDQRQPEPSALLGLVSVLGLGAFAKGRKQS